MRVLLTAIAITLAFAASAAADDSPVRLWSVSKVTQGDGVVPVGNGSQVGGELKQYTGVGDVAFNLPLHAPFWYFLPRDHAYGGVFSNASGAQYSVLAQAPNLNPHQPGSPAG